MRTTRKQSESGIYHVVTRGVGRQLIFEDDKDRAFFLELLAQAASDSGCTLYAWCLMTNHVHLLLKASPAELSSFTRAVFGRYAQYFNNRHDRVGHLFQERFWSEPVDGDEYFLAALRYVHQNPERSNISKTTCYYWSSYSEYTSYTRKGKQKALCDTDFALEMLGGVEAFVRFHGAIDEKSHFIDVDNPSGSVRSMSNEAVVQLVKSVSGFDNLYEIKSLDRSARNKVLRKLRDAGLSIRQIERLTGIGRGIIQGI